MRRSDRMPLWLTLTFVTIFAIVLVGGGGFYFSIKEHLRRQVEANLMAIAILKVNTIVAWRKDQLSEAKEVMSDSFLIERVRRWTAGADATSATTIRSIFRILGEERGYDDILLVDTSGKVRLSLSGREQTLDECAREGLAKALRGRCAIITDIHTGKENPSPHIGIVAPLYSNHSHTPGPVGAVILMTNAEHFLFPLIQTWPIHSRTAETALVRRDGDSVLFLNEVRHLKGAALKLRIPLTRTDVSAVKAVLGRQGIVLGHDYRGAEVISALTPVPDSPWFMISEIDTSEAFEELHRDSILILCVVIGLLLTTAALWGMAWQRIHKLYYRDLFRAEAALRQTEQRHRVTLMSVGDAVIATDAAGKVELLNPCAENLTGWTQEEARGRNIEEVFRIINQETRLPVENPVQRVLREGLVVGLANHTVLIARDGAERPIADSGAPIRDEQGQLIGVVLVFRDQTEQRAAERALQEAHARFIALVEAMPDMAYLKDANGHNLILNRAFEQFTGIKREDAIGKKDAEILPPDLAERCGESDAQVLNTRTTVRVEESTTTPDGQVFWFETIKGPIFDANGQITGIVGVSRDITDRKRMEATLERDRNLLRTVIDNLPDYIYAKDRDSRFLLSNAAHARLVGAASPEEMEGRTDYDYYPRELADKFYCDEQQILATGESVFNAEEPREGGTGNKTWIASTNVPVRNAAGEIMGLVGISRDITELKHREDLLRVLHNLAREVCSQLDLHGVLSRAVDGLVQVFDSRRVAVFAYVRDRENHSLRLEAFREHPAESSEVEHAPYKTHFPLEGTRFGVCLASGEPLYTPDLTVPDEKDTRTLVAHGIYSDVLLPIVAGSQPLGALAVGRGSVNGFTDTEVSFLSQFALHLAVAMQNARLYADLQKAYAQLQETYEKAAQEERLRALGQMASGIAHDLNNALSPVLGFSELMLMHPDMLDDRNAVRCNLELIAMGARDAANVVRRLREFYRKRADREAFLPVDLNSIVKQSVSLTQPRWKDQALASGATIRVETDLTKVRVVPGNETELREALANLILNAVDAMPDGGTITISTREENDAVLLQVTDTGMGMDDEIRQRCLDPFFTTKGNKGTGLGLSIVFGVVTRHEGTIDVASEPGEGTTVTLRLPVYAETPQEAIPEETGKALPPLKVLVVDDEPALRHFLTECLTSDGHSVETASNGREGFVKFHAGWYDIVITDQAMSEMTGEQLAAAIRRTAPHKPIVMLTGFGDTMHATAQKPRDVDLVLSKPVTPAALRKALVEAMRQTRAHR